MTQPHYIDREAVALVAKAINDRAGFTEYGPIIPEGLLEPIAEAAIAAWNRRPAMEAVAWREALDQLRRASVDLDEAHDMIVEWSAYADEYFQQKHDLATDLARIKLAAGEARRKHVQALAVIPTHGGGE